MKIRINFENAAFEAELYDTPTAKAIYNNLPQEAYINTWGNEIYFITDTQCDLEHNARTELEVGDLAYYPAMPAFCIFYGPTPISTNDKPVAAGKVNVFGRLINADVNLLRNVNSGSVKIESDI